MKRFSRREFLKLSGRMAAILGLSPLLVTDMAEALEQSAAGNPPVLWIQGASCTGDSVSLLNSVEPDIKDVLLDIISLRFHPTVMAAAGDLAMSAMEETSEKAKGKYYLVVEGAVPKDDGGVYCTVGENGSGKPITFLNLLERLSKDAAAIIAVGTCATSGGIPAGAPNPTGCVGVSEVVKGTPVINIPGCPAHPDWILGSLAHVLLYKKVPALDGQGRPKLFFGKLIHDNCPRRQYFDNSIFARSLSEEGCLFKLGCKGPMTHADCPTRQWNNGVNFCIKAGAPCIGCAEVVFPDETSPMYKQMPDIALPGIRATADGIGKVVGAATAVGIGAHFVGSIVTGRLGGKNTEEEGEE